MTAEEFIEEVHHSKLMPPDFDQCYAEFRKYQQLAIDALNEFHRVCEKNKLDYVLAWGSLLGAVRDNGQIPWDYDVDVFVPFQQKRMLIEALKKDLNDKYYFYCPEVDSKCRHMFIRIAPKGYRTEFIHVDIFDVTGTPDNSEERKLFAEKLSYLFDIRFYKLVSIIDHIKRGKIRGAIRLYLKRLQYLFKSVETVTQEHKMLCQKYDVKTSKFCIVTKGSKYYFPCELLWNTELCKTNIGELRITKHYDAILRQMYSNYMQVPKLENRINECMSAYKRLSKYSRV